MSQVQELASQSRQGHSVHIGHWYPSEFRIFQGFGSAGHPRAVDVRREAEVSEHVQDLAQVRVAARVRLRHLAEVPEADRPIQAWAAWLRVLLSSNEFLYVD